MSEELLYTQEDINEWMRACYDLQVHLRELEDVIKARDKQLALYKRALQLASIDVGAIAIITKILKDNEVRATSEDVINYYLDQAKKELEEENAKD